MPTATIDSRATVQQFRLDGTIFDRFTRANSAVTLDSLDSGETWAVETGSGAVWGVSEQQPYVVSGANTISGAVVETSISTAVLIELNVTVTEGHSAGIIYRSDGNHTAGNKWLALLTIASAAGRLTIQRVSAGVATTIATISGLSVAEGGIVKLGVHLFDATQKFFLNDNLLHELSDATHQARTKHGIIVTANGTKNLDNFFVREVGANQTVTMRANLQNTVARAIQLRGAVRNTVPQSTTIRAAVTAQQQQQLSLRASVLARVRLTETAGEDLTQASAGRVTHEDADEFSVDRVVLGGQDAYIWTLDTQFLESHEGKTTLRANIRGVTSRSLTLRAKLTAQQIQGISLRGRIAPRFFKTIFLRARVLAAPSASIQLRASVRKTVTQEFTIRARIRRIEFGNQMRASVSNTVTQTMEMRARITPQEQAKVQLRASIQQLVTKSTTMRARVLPETRLSMRALILGFVTGSTEVTFDVLQQVVARITVSFDVTAGEKKSAIQTMRARIASPRTASVTVEFNVHAPMPDELATRPTERIKTP